METRHSVCALDCPDACAMLVQVENGRATTLRGDPDHPVTRGFLCGKVARYLDREYSPERLLYPQKRVGEKGEGRFERISWDEALDTIADRLASMPASSAPKQFCLIATPAPWDCSTTPEWTGDSSIVWARRGWTAPFVPPPVERR